MYFILWIFPCPLQGSLCVPFPQKQTFLEPYQSSANQNLSMERKENECLEWGEGQFCRRNEKKNKGESPKLENQSRDKAWSLQPSTTKSPIMTTEGGQTSGGSLMSCTERPGPRQRAQHWQDLCPRRYRSSRRCSGFLRRSQGRPKISSQNNYLCVRHPQDFAM